MANSIYIAGINAGTGKSLISIGLMSILTQEYERCLFFKPVANLGVEGQDNYVHLIQQYFELPFPEEDLYSLSCEEYEQLMANGNEQEVFQRALTQFKKLENKSDFVLIEGTDYQAGGTPTEFANNVKIANNLGSQILLVANGADRTTKQIIQQVDSALNALKDIHAETIGVVVNRVEAEQEQQLKEALLSNFGKQLTLIHTIATRRSLSEPTVAEVAKLIGAEVICGKSQLSRTVSGYTIAAKHVGAFLNTEKDRKNLLIITPGDRVDILLGSMLADQSKHYPKIAGLLLTTNEKPRDTIMGIIKGLKHPFAVLTCDTSTFGTAEALAKATFHTRLDQPEKIKSISEHFQAEVNVSKLLETLTNAKSSIVTPQMFSYRLIQKARSMKRHIVLPEGEDFRILKAAAYLLKRNIVDITILGNASEIEALAKQGDLDLSGAQILDPHHETELHEKYANQYFELRKHKQVNLTIAKDRLLETTYFGTMMVYFGDADGMVSGAAHTTGETIKPALEVIKTQPNINKVSSVFLMCLKDRVIVYGDCAINPQPDAQTLAEIALKSSETALKFGIDPRVAMLSYSSGSSGQGESVDRVREATAMVRSIKPNLLIEGPIQYDAAVDMDIAQKKMPDSAVAGRATVLIFPDLNTGNNTYKAVQRETGAIAIGPVLQGLNKPVNDLSRGCTVADIINTVVITAIQSQETS